MENMHTRLMPTQQRAATLAPTTYDAATRSVEVTWTTGAMVRRMDWWSGTHYDEELVVTPEAVDMTRLASGNAPVLNTHNGYSLEAQIGVVTAASIEAGEGRATLRLSEREDLAGIVADIASGIIRNISVGYTVNKYEVVSAANRTDGGLIPIYRAVSWQPAELSFVPIPADAGSSTRNQPSQGNPCEFIRAAAQPSQELPMSKDVPASGGNPAPATLDATATHTAAVTAAVTAANQRATDITSLCVRHGMADQAAALIASPQTIDQVRAKVLDDLATRDAAQGGNLNVRVETMGDEMQTRMAGMEQAISHRVDGKTKLDDNGRQYRGMSLLEIGRDFLQSHGVNTRGMERMQLAQRMLHFRAGTLTTSDFSSLFANVANKRLRAAYDENAGTYALWARRAPNAPDFKAMQVTQLSGAPDLLQTNEAGEFKYGAMSDGKETYGVLTYGRIVPLSRQAIVNDDLRAFDRMVTAFGFSARRLENRTVYAQLTANAALSDSLALFEAGTHKNLGTGAPSALSAASLTTARAAMRVQKGLQAEELNLAPTYLIVPAALEQTAYQLTSNQYVPATQGAVNEFRQGGRTALDPIVESVLDGSSLTGWYLAANSNQVDTVEYCYLDGAEGVVIESDPGFETDGVSFKARLDFAAKAIDYRGLYKANGV